MFLFRFSPFIDSIGLKWRSGASLLENTQWRINGKDTRYSIERNGVGYGARGNSNALLHFYDYFEILEKGK